MTMFVPVVVMIDVQGVIDLDTAPELRSRVDAAIDNHPGDEIVLDLSALTFIDSYGLGVLLGTLKKARLGGGDVCITRPPDAVWKVFAAARLATAFHRDDRARTTTAPLARRAMPAAPSPLPA